MNVSDLTTGDSERRAAEDALIQTEQTDAVNAGLVGNADKSGQMIKDDLFERRTGNFSSSDASSKSANAVSAGEGSSGVESALKDSGTEVGASATPSRLSRGLKAARKAAVVGAVHKTLEGTEFEGVDEAYYKGKASYKLAKKGAKVTSEKVSEFTKSLRSLNEKKYRNPKSQETLQREMQSKRNQFTSRSIQAEKAARASSVTGSAAVESAKGASAVASSGGGGAVAAASGGCLIPFVLVLLSVIIFIGLLTAILGGNNSSSGNGFGPLFYWVEFETGATDDSAFDSVTLDDGLGGQAYGVQFDYRYSLQEFLPWLYKQDIEKWSMFEPYIAACEAHNSAALYASSESSGLPAAWHSAYNAHRDEFIAAQKEYIQTNTLQPKIDELQAAGFDFSERATVCQGAVLSYIHQHGSGSLTASTLRRAGISNDTSDADFLSKLYSYRTQRYGNYGGLDLASRYERELPVAMSYLYYDNANGNVVVQRAYEEMGKPYSWGAVGPDSYDCSGLVSYCLTGKHERLGSTGTFLGWPRVSDPQPGDICVSTSHCGIYIGNGQMIHAPHTGDVVKIGPVHSDMVYVCYSG